MINISLDSNVLTLFKKVIEEDLKTLAIRISREREIPLDTITPYIDIILNIPMIDRIRDKYLDMSSIKYKNELQRYALQDLREIAAHHSVSVSGTRRILIDNICEKCGIRDFTQEEILKSKSYISIKTKTSHKKSSDQKIDTHLVDDSDDSS